MKQRDRSEPSRLLEDLESIRTLLDEHPESLPDDTAADAQLDIPLLQDVVLPTDELPPGTRIPDSPPQALDRPHNPFLPYASLARLAEERVQLDQLLSGNAVQASTDARQVRLEARIQAEAQLILQGIIDDLIPTIEDQLRKRLQGKLQQIIQEQLKR
jgi:hypothetical protein